MSNHYEHFISVVSGASLAMVEHSYFPMLNIGLDPLLNLVLDSAVKGIVGGAFGYLITFALDKILKRNK